ncbi:MAG: hypothetical protein GY749_01530 [Desulfobacteraceae bacterium]|nr:hypothetical protein [Desulfobacteraceae bacterium]
MYLRFLPETEKAQNYRFSDNNPFQDFAQGVSEEGVSEYSDCLRTQ